jgi:hypothetical protein
MFLLNTKHSKLSKRKISRNPLCVNPVGLKSQKYHQYLYRAHVVENLLNKFDKDIKQKPLEYSPYQIATIKINLLAEIFLFNAAGHLLRDVTLKKTPEESHAVKDLINYYAEVDKKSYQHQMIDDCLKFIAEQRNLGFGNNIPYDEYDNYLMKLENIRKAHNRDWCGKNTYNQPL